MRKRILILASSLVSLNLVSAQNNPSTPDANWQEYLVDHKKGFRHLAVTVNFLEPLLYGSLSAGVQYMPFKYLGFEGGAGIGVLNSGVMAYSLQVSGVLLPPGSGGFFVPEEESYKPQSTSYMMLHFPVTHNSVDCFTSFGLYVRNRRSQLTTSPQPNDQQKTMVSSTNIGLSVNAQFILYRNLLLGYSAGVGRENYDFSGVPYYRSASGTGMNDYVRKDVNVKAWDLFLQFKLGYALL
jgi:hypothetical protein